MAKQDTETLKEHPPGGCAICNATCVLTDEQAHKVDSLKALDIHAAQLYTSLRSTFQLCARRKKVPGSNPVETTSRTIVYQSTQVILLLLLFLSFKQHYEMFSQ